MTVNAQNRALTNGFFTFIYHLTKIDCRNASVLTCYSDSLNI